MNTEQSLAVAIFEDEQREIKRLEAVLPDVLKIISLTTIDLCSRFVDDAAYAAELLGPAVLIACIVDGNIAPTTFDKKDGVQLLAKMRKEPRFADVLLISNSGGGELQAAHAHLQKSGPRMKQYLASLVEIHQQWKLQGKGKLNFQ